MATYISDSSDEFGRSVAQSKLESKVRADFELTGFVRDWLLIVRPFQKIIAEHSDLMVQQGVMTREEAVHWLNMHWELICAEPKRVSGGCAIAAYGRERQTRAVVHVKQESFVGYSRIRLKAETFVLPRSGAGEDEMDLDDLTVAGVSQRHAEAAAEPLNPEMSGEAPSAGLDLEEFPFAGIEVEENEGSGRASREWGVGEVWAKVDFDDDYYEAIMEFWGVLKEEKHAEHLEMAEEAAEIAREEEVQLGDDPDSPFDENEEQVDRTTCKDPGRRALWHMRVENWGRDLTWAGEGPDAQTQSPHVPGETSGLTMGKGWDAKHRTPKQIKKELQAIGLSKELAESLSEFGDPSGPGDKVSGLTGGEAKGKLAAAGLKGLKLTKEQQARLFALTYKQESDRAQALYSKCKNPKWPAWKELHPAIRAVWTDLKYVGHNTKVSREKIMPAVKSNDPKQLLKVMSDKKFWTSDHKGLSATGKDRFDKRLLFLKSVVRSEDTGPGVCR